MHSTNKLEKSGAERSGVFGPDPESPEIRKIREKVRILRVLAQQKKNRFHIGFQSSINCS
jgi:hypothetical protein